MPIPTNVADAASAVRDGVFGQAQDIKIGDLLVSALMGLDTPDETAITDKPVQAGYSVNDMAVDLPQIQTWNIILTNPDISAESAVVAAFTGDASSLTQTWRDKKDQLYQYKKDRELLDIQTHEELFSNFMVQSIIPNYDVNENLDAFVCTVQLKQIKLIDIEEVTDQNNFANAMEDIGVF